MPLKKSNKFLKKYNIPKVYKVLRTVYLLLNSNASFLNLNDDDTINPKPGKTCFLSLIYNFSKHYLEFFCI